MTVSCFYECIIMKMKMMMFFYKVYTDRINGREGNDNCGFK